MKSLIVILAVAACAYATPSRPNDWRRHRALYNTPQKPSVTSATVLTVETTTPANYGLNSNRGEMISPETSESFKSLMALADIARRVFEFASSFNLGRLFSVEGFRSISYVIAELAPLILGPYSGILRVLLSSLTQDTNSSVLE